MKNVRVTFKQSISTGIGSFAPGHVDVIPEDHAGPWLDQGVCELHADQKGVDKKAPDSIVTEDKVKAEAKAVEEAKAPKVKKDKAKK